MSKNPLLKRCSVSRTVKEADKLTERTISSILKEIKDGSHKGIVEKIRKAVSTGNETEKDKLKERLLSPVFSGVFKDSRGKENLVRATGVLVLDFDHVPDLAALRAAVNDDKYTLFSFRSPSGDGLKVGAKIPIVSDDNEFKAIWEGIIGHYSQYSEVKADPLCKDISRVCYVSYDPDLFQNPNAEEFPFDWNAWISEQERIEAERKAKASREQAALAKYRKKHTQNGEAEKALERAFTWKRDALAIMMQSAVKGTQHETRLKAGRLAGGILAGFGSLFWTESAAIEWLMQHYNGETDQKARKELKAAIEYGRQTPITDGEILVTWEEWKRQHPLEPKPHRSQYPPHPADDPNVQSAGADEPPVADAPPVDDTTTVNTLPEWAFWAYEAYRNTISVSISPLKYVDFLEKQGFRVFMKRGEPTIVKETSEGMEKTRLRGRINTTVKETVLAILEKENFQDVVDHLLTNSKFFTLDVLEVLPEIPRDKARASIFSEHETHISFDTPLEKEDPLISFNDTAILIAGNTLALVGKQGLGKSGVCELFASQAIAPECEKLSPFTFNPQGGLVLWIDTERTSNDMVYALKRIKERTQAWRSENADILNDTKTNFRRLRVERCAAVEDKMTWLLELLDTIEEPIDLIIIDGALDMVDSMNDEAGAKHFYDDIQTIVNKKQCGVILTIHSAPSDENGRGMGHIGGVIMRKCSSFLQIRNSKDAQGIKELSTDFAHAKMRHGKDWGVYAAMQWDEDDNMLHFVDHTPSSNSEQSENHLEEIRETVEWVYGNEAKPRSKNELIEQYLTAYSELRKRKITERTARRHLFDKAEPRGIIVKSNGLYFLDSKPFS